MPFLTKQEANLLLDVVEDAGFDTGLQEPFCTIRDLLESEAMIRYLLDPHAISCLYLKNDTKSEKIDIKWLREVQGHNFVDILEVQPEDVKNDRHWARIKIYVPDGSILIGWVPSISNNNPLRIYSTRRPDLIELFDGRFNSDF